MWALLAFFFWCMAIFIFIVVFADLTGLAPLLVQVGANEVLSLFPGVSEGRCPIEVGELECCRIRLEHQVARLRLQGIHFIQT